MKAIKVAIALGMLIASFQAAWACDRNATARNTGSITDNPAVAHQKADAVLSKTVWTQSTDSSHIAR